MCDYNRSTCIIVSGRAHAHAHTPPNTTRLLAITNFHLQGFYDFVALPLVHALASAFPGARPLLTAFRRNYGHWRAVETAASNSGK